MNKLLSFFRRKEHPDYEALSAYLDARLDPAEATAMTAHLAGCELCRGEFDVLAAAKRMLAALPDATPQRSFRLRPSEAEPRPAHREPSPLLMRAVPMLGAAAVSVFAVAAGIDAFSRGGSSDSSASRPIAAFSRDTSQSPAAARSGDLPAEGGVAAAPTAASNTSKSAAPTTDASQGSEPATAAGDAAVPPAITPEVAQAPAPLAPATDATGPATYDAAPSAPEAPGAGTQSAETPPSGVALSGEPTGAPSAPVTEASRPPRSDSGGGIGALRIVEIIAGAAVLAAAGVTVVFRLRNKEADR